MEEQKNVLQVWIIEKKTSNLLYFRSYSDIPIKEYVITGFFHAINQFTSVELHQSGIDNIVVGDIRLAYTSDKGENLYLVGADKKNCDPSILKVKLRIIKDIFIHEFNLNEHFWNERLHELSRFKRFTPIIDQLVEQWNKAEQTSLLGELFDKFGVFQQLFIKVISVGEKHLEAPLMHKIFRELNLLNNKLLQEKHKYINHYFPILSAFIPHYSESASDLVFEDKNSLIIRTIEYKGLSPEDTLIEHKNEILEYYLEILRTLAQSIRAVIGEKIWFEEFKKGIKPILLEEWMILEKDDLIRKIFSILL